MLVSVHLCQSELFGAVKTLQILVTLAYTLPADSAGLAALLTFANRVLKKDKEGDYFVYRGSS